jgi:hypothetical protein
METDQAVITTGAPLAIPSAQDPYLRHPLDPSSSQIRILKLLPAPDPQAPLQCQLRVDDLGDKSAEYEALSYVWGAYEHRRHLCIEGPTLSLQTTYMMPYDSCDIIRIPATFGLMQSA